MSEVRYSGDLVIQWDNIGPGFNISGYCRAGEVFAFLGPENNLLRSIYFADEGPVTKISVNGNRLNSSLSNTSIISTGDSSNCLYDELTVMETLRFSDALRSSDRSYKTIAFALETMGLSEISRSIIKNLSEAQKLKVLIAAELVSDHRVIFLEYVTDGLKSSDRIDILDSLQCCAKAGWLVAVSMSTYNRHNISQVNQIQIVSNEESLYFGAVSGVDNYLNSLGFNSIVSSPKQFGISVEDFILSVISQRKENKRKNISEPLPISEPVKSGAITVVSDPESGESFVTPNVPMVGGKAELSYPTSPMHDKSDSMSAAEIQSNKVHINNWTINSTIDLTIDNSVENAQGSNTWHSILSREWRRLCWVSWRAGIVRIRNIDHLVMLLIYASVVPGIGVGFTFYQLKDDITGFQDLTVVLTVLPYGLILLQNIWYNYDIKERLILMYERQGRFNHTLYFPICTTVVDVVILRLPYMLLGIVLSYDMIGLSTRLESRLGILFTTTLMSGIGALLARWFFILVMHTNQVEVAAKGAVISSSTYCFMVLYAGILMNLSSLPDWKWFIRDWSFFYWGCNNLYFYENTDKDYVALTTPGSNSSAPTTVVDVNINVVDVPQICTATPDWCEYCANATETRRFIHPNYTCTFTQYTDLCTSTNLSSSSYCDYALTPHNTSTTVYVSGLDLLTGASIPDIGYTKAYSVLFQQGSVYFVLVLLSIWILQRHWTKREIKLLRKSVGLS